MPTGYTAAIAKGISFKQFALDCSRAFNIDMKEAPQDAPIPKEKLADPYHANKVIEERSSLLKIESLSAEECELRARKSYDETRAELTKHKQEGEELRSKYEAMLTQAKAYVPPSPEHQGFANFMVSQIEESIRFDCGVNYENMLESLPLRSGEEWRAFEIEQIKRSIAYHEEGAQKEQERAQQGTIWLRQLHESLTT